MSASRGTPVTPDVRLYHRAVVVAQEATGALHSPLTSQSEEMTHTLAQGGSNNQWIYQERPAKMLLDKMVLFSPSSICTLYQHLFRTWHVAFLGWHYLPKMKRVVDNGRGPEWGFGRTGLEARCTPLLRSSGLRLHDSVITTTFSTCCLL